MEIFMTKSNVSFSKTIIAKEKSTNFNSLHIEKTLDNIPHIVQKFLDDGFMPFVSDLRNIIFAELNKIGIQNIQTDLPVYFNKNDIDNGYLHYFETLSCLYKNKRFQFKLEIEIDLDENLLTSFEIELPEKFFKN